MSDRESIYQDQAIVRPHGHYWINRQDPPIERRPYSPWIGPQQREMKAGETYHCRTCGESLTPREYSQ